MKNFKYTVIGIIFLLAGYFVIDTIIDSLGVKSQVKEVKTVEIAESKEFITFGRYGNSKGIYCTTSNIKRDSKIFEGRLEMLKAAKDKFFFNYWTNISDELKNQNLSMTFESVDMVDRCHGIYTCDMDGRDIKCLSKDYIMLDNPAVSLSGDMIVFTGVKVTNGIIEQCIDFGVYSISAASQKTVKLKIKCEGREDISDISFAGNNEILYSKKVYKAGEYSTQLYKYNLQTEKEEQLTKGKNNYLNPCVSPDGKKLAYLSFSQSKGIYGINIVETADISKVIYSDTNDAVIGGSTQWSFDSSKILYVVLSGMDGKAFSSSKIKISDINKKASEYIDEGYIGTFSPDSSSIAYANYKIEKKGSGNPGEFEYRCVETIYRKKIGGSSSIALEYDEDCLFSKSINIISWNK